MSIAQPTKVRTWTPDTLRTGPSKDDRGLLGQPRGLPWMLNVEMWERFSYYGMRAILLFFITDEIANGGLGISPNTGQTILAVYGAAVFLLSIPGGIFADRVIGPWRSTFYGGIVIMAGHICLSIPIDSLAWAGIVLVAVGTGFIKPNLSTIVGGLYDQGDPRRDTGFQLFYMSINVGAFASAFAFDIPNPLDAEDRNKLLLISLSSAAGTVFVAWALYLFLGTWPDAIAYTIFVIALGASITYFVIMFRSPKVTSPERTHLRAYISLWIGAVLFFMIFEQASGKMATFSKDFTDGKTPFGWVISPEAYQSVNPAVIVLLAPLVGWFFSRRTGRAIPTVIKFAAAVLIVGLSAVMMGYGFQSWTGGTDLAPWWFLALVFIVQTVGELFLSPVGLSTTTALAPKSFASQAMVL
ncbi:MAG: MFS transporter, partial [Actinomyces sp.]